jgi:hypothetical protein
VVGIEDMQKPQLTPFLAWCPSRFQQHNGKTATWRAFTIEHSFLGQLGEPGNHIIFSSALLLVYTVDRLRLMHAKNRGIDDRSGRRG